MARRDACEDVWLTSARAAIAAVAVVLLLCGCSGTSGVSVPSTTSEVTETPRSALPQPPSARPSSPSGTASSADIAFASVLLQQVQQALALADVAERRSTNPAVMRHAQTMADAHRSQSVALVSWLSAWNEAVPGPAQWDDGDPHDKPGVLSSAQLANLDEVSTALFDRSWLSAVATHHRGTLTIAREEQATGGNPSVKRLAAAQIVSHQRDLAGLQLVTKQLAGS